MEKTKRDIMLTVLENSVDHAKFFLELDDYDAVKDVLAAMLDVLTYLATTTPDK